MEAVNVVLPEIVNLVRHSSPGHYDTRAMYNCITLSSSIKSMHGQSVSVKYFSEMMTYFLSGGGE